MTRLLSATLVVLGLFLLSARALAQEDRLEAVVQYIAGVNIYLNVGTQEGINPGDTLFAYSEPDGALLGAFEVIGSSEGRAVVTFAGRPFPVTRGDVLQLVIRSPGQTAPATRPIATSDELAGQATLHQENGSGISARIAFTDRGGVLSVRGTAVGMDPGHEYASWLYDNGSVAHGPTACISTNGQRSIMVGTWHVDSSGNGRLTATNDGADYAALGSFKTVDVRNASDGYLLVACGEVRVRRPAEVAQRPRAAPPVPAGDRPPPQQRLLPRSTPHRSLQASGRLSVDLNVLESSTQVGGAIPAPVDRRFTTPSLRFRTAVANLPGGLGFNTNLRASSRYSTGDVIQPAQSLRVYQASLAKEFESVPIQMQLGRFYNPHETFSGYWDGLLLHLGGQGLGAGVALGFQPDRQNEGVTTDLPKYTAFLDYQYRGNSLSYRADLSYTEVKPQIDLFDRRFFGLAQRFRLQRFTLNQRLQVDRNPETDKREVTQVEVRTSVPVGRKLALRTQFSMRQPYSIFSSKASSGFKRERGSVGFAYSLAGGTIGADVTANRLDGTDISYAYGSHFNFPRTAFLSLGFNGSASYWKRNSIKTLFLSPGIRRSFGRLDSRLSYQLYSTANSVTTITTHTFDLAFSFPLTRRWFTILQARSQRGSNLTSNSLYTGLWVGF